MPAAAALVSILAGVATTLAVLGGFMVALWRAAGRARDLQAAVRDATAAVATLTAEFRVYRDGMADITQRVSQLELSVYGRR
jgi:Flp pilus assembly protein TadG